MSRAPLVIAGTVAGLAATLAAQNITSNGSTLHSARGSVPVTMAKTPPVKTPHKKLKASHKVKPVNKPTSHKVRPVNKPTAHKVRPVSKPAPTRVRPVSNPTATGEAVQSQYSTIQLRVTRKGGKIVKIDVVRDDTGDGRSASINAHAEPILMQQALAAQSSHIDGVSGASYTSDSYRQSLQSALDKLGA